MEDDREAGTRGLDSQRETWACAPGQRMLLEVTSDAP